jgi:hypothetical protein
MRAATTRFAFIVGSALALAPGIASAQGWGTGEPRDLITPYGEYFLLGGGVSGFTDGPTKDRFDTGGTWDVRLGFGNRYYVGAELAYVGSARSGSGSSTDLVTNGAEAVLRLQYPYATGSWLVEPFAFGGLGWSHQSLRNAAPGLKTSGDAGVVPFGGGITVGYDRFLFDARFTYRTSFNEELALAVNQGAANLAQWSVGASVGYEF